MVIKLINHKFITFEGIDGSGKSTQIKLLNEWLDSQNIEKVNIREPGGESVSEAIRSILLSRDNKINSFSETLLFLASRAQLSDQIIIPALKENKFVICDRFIDSTVVYQGYGRGLDIEFIKTINAIATQQILPFLTIFINISLKSSITRRAIENNDRMESSGDEFLLNVKNGYEKLANLYSDRIQTVNGEDTIDNVQKQIRKIVKEKYKGLLC